MAADEKRSRTRRFGWDRPRWRDRAFLAAVGITVALVAAQALLLGDRGSPLWYVNLGVRAVVTWILISAVIRIRVGIRRGLVRGYQEGEERAAASGPSAAERAARSSGRTVGRAVAAYKKSQQKPPG